MKKTRLEDPFHPSDAIAAPDAVERNSDTVWQMFQELSIRQDHRFAETLPADLSLKQTDIRYADTHPLDHGPAVLPTYRPAPPPAVATSDDLMIEARRHNRVCPRPEVWLRLYDMLPGRQRGLPSPPLTGAAWTATSPLAKRMCLREHLEWAAAHGAAADVHAFLRAIPESEWLHMGDD